MRLLHLVPALLVAATLAGAEGGSDGTLTSEAVLARAEALVTDGKPDKAIELLTAWTREHPEDTAARRRLLNLQVSTKEAEIRDLVRQQADERDLMLADQEYEGARQRASEDVQRRLRAAEYLINQSRHGEALEAVNRILRDHPEDQACLRMKFRLLDHLAKRQRESLERVRASARADGLNQVSIDGTFPAEKPKVKRQVFEFQEDIEELERARVAHRLQERVDLTMEKAKVWEVMEQLFKVAGINYVVLDSAIGEETVTLNLKNDTIESALEAVGRLAEVRFAYDRGTVFVSSDADESLVTEIIRLKSGLTNVDAAASSSAFSGSGGAGSSGGDSAATGGLGRPVDPRNPAGTEGGDRGAQRTPASGGGNGGAGGGGSGGQTDLERFIEKVPELVVGWPSEGVVRLERKSNSIFIKATPWAIAEFKRLLHALDYNNVQVLIEARFVEVSESAFRNLGVEWSKIGRGNPLSPAPALSATLGSAGDARDGASQVVANVVSGKLFFNAKINALESEGQADTLAEPKILTLNNAEGVIEIVNNRTYISNYTTQSNSSNSTVNNGTVVSNQNTIAVPQLATIESGIQLKIRPSVARNADVITLSLQPTIRRENPQTEDEKPKFKYFPNSNGEEVELSYETPTIATRTLSTALHIKNGEAVVLGGLIEESDSRSKTNTPFLGTIPILGNLFGSKSSENKRSNLIILVSANIVDPSGAKQGDEIERLRDTARILLPMDGKDALPETADAAAPAASAPAAPAAPPSNRPIGPANYRGER